jgi:hypothetical protein
MTDRPGGPGTGAGDPGGSEDPSTRRTEKVDLGAVPADDAGRHGTEKFDVSGRGSSDATPPEGTPATGQEKPDDEAPRGRVRYQDPSTTKPREPTVAEQRARREAERRERAQADAAAAAAERKRKNRKRVLVGGGVAVGVVALVAIVYAASQPDEVTAQCTDPNGVVVPDENCTSGVQQGGYYDSGGAFVPIFIGGFGNQYHYNYGSNSPVGSVARGGTTAPPSSGTSVRSGTSGGSLGTSSGSGTVSRGGLGVGGSSSSGSSSGSSGSSSGSSGSGSSSGS